ncbi:diacylglycerol kinase [Leptolyngbya sp. PCC 6406]|uniref:diacylglycerol kinase n=1 Tax=Leptolyngbya sp. PCC 6406 TaxID=1173264 RepID=UPI0002AC2B0A|nr:diacylglycerol kinase family protein [Leptolyngbya sp. PCC 6406]
MPPSPHVPQSPAPSTTGSPTADRRYAWQVATNLWVSFRYAGQGIAYALRTQRNFRIHTAMGVIVLALGLGLALPAVQIAVLGLTCGGVLTLELINTALEAVVDLTVQQTYHELAKIAKDCAAAAVLISALVAVWVAVCLLVPPLYQLIYSA